MILGEVVMSNWGTRTGYHASVQCKALPWAVLHEAGAGAGSGSGASASSPSSPSSDSLSTNTSLAAEPSASAGAEACSSCCCWPGSKLVPCSQCLSASDSEGPPNLRKEYMK